MFSIQFSSVQSFSCVRLLCNPMNHSTPGLPVHHQLPEFTQTHVHRVSDAIQPSISSSVVPFSSCPQSLPVSESFPMSQLFTSGGQSTGVSVLASFLPKNTQGWSPCSPRDSQESSPTPQFKSINSSTLSFLHSPTLTSTPILNPLEFSPGLSSHLMVTGTGSCLNYLSRGPPIAHLWGPLTHQRGFQLMFEIQPGSSVQSGATLGLGGRDVRMRRISWGPIPTQAAEFSPDCIQDFEVLFLF